MPCGSPLSSTRRPCVSKRSGQETTRDLDHVRLLADRIEAYLEGLRETRDLGEKEDDVDTMDLLTGIVTEFEKHAWFLRASLER